MKFLNIILICLLSASFAFAGVNKDANNGLTIEDKEQYDVLSIEEILEEMTNEVAVNLPRVVDKMSTMISVQNYSNEITYTTMIDILKDASFQEKMQYRKDYILETMFRQTRNMLCEDETIKYLLNRNAKFNYEYVTPLRKKIFDFSVEAKDCDENVFENMKRGRIASYTLALSKEMPIKLIKDGSIMMTRADPGIGEVWFTKVVDTKNKDVSKFIKEKGHDTLNKRFRVQDIKSFCSMSSTISLIKSDIPILVRYFDENEYFLYEHRIDKKECDNFEKYQQHIAANKK